MNTFRSHTSRIFSVLCSLFFLCVCFFPATVRADITTGLIGHYTFDTASLTSNVADSSGQGNHAFIKNGMATSTIAGPVGQALVFNGTGYVEMTNSVAAFDFERDETFTISLWYKSTKSVMASDPSALFYNDPTGSIGYFMVEAGFLDTCSSYPSGDSSSFVIAADTGSGVNLPSYCPTTGTNYRTNWVNYVITFSGMNMSLAYSPGPQSHFKMYRNGVLLDTPMSGGVDPGALMRSAWPLQIGGDLNGFTFPLSGYIDDLRIYNRALSTNDALEIYKLGYSASVTTSVASLVSTSTATLNGSITSQSGIASSTSRGFVYGTTSGIYTSTTSDTGTYGVGAFSKNLTGLTQNTTYYFKAFALNATSTNYGSELSFTTTSDVDPPTVSQLFASAVSYTSATLNSQITATGGSDATQYGFAYGTSANLSTVIATSTLGSYSGTGFLEQAVSGLSPGTTYYFRSYATNSGGTSFSAIESFTTRSYSPPTTIPSDASLIAITTATLNGSIQDTNGSSATSRGFVYGTTLSFGATTTEAGIFETGAYSASVTGLSANTTYYYKSYATNGSGTSYSTDVKTFTTLASTATSVVETNGLTLLGTTTVTLHGDIISTGGSDTITHGFAYGTSPTLSSVIATSSLGTYSGTGSFSGGLTGLTANTKYYYRAYVTNAIGTSYGAIKSFVTVDNNGASISFDLPSGGMQNYTLQLNVTVNSGDPSITIEWPLESGVTSYTIYRKATTDINWGSSIASVLYGSRRFVDTNISLGTKYEYKVVKNITGGTFAYGYLYSGIEVPLVDDRGKVILVVDDATVAAMTDEVNQLVLDLSGDGWTVIYEEVDDSTATVSSVKTLIEGHYDADPTNVKAVFLVGAIPVPYSGNINPDGHSDHRGAWPADAYYGEMNAVWTDSTVNNTSSTGTINDNVPGDGKFDQSLSAVTANSNIEIAVGRLDLRSMGSFGTANALHEQYLNRNHNYRIGNYTTVDRAFLSDNFGVFGGEAFAASGWRSFSPLIGGDNIVVSTSSADFLNNIRTINYKWVYGAGGAGYTGASGVANSSDYAAAPTYGVFNMLFGSYFGDWNNSDNFLRAPLASAGGALTSVWSGRPHWYFHPAGIGEPMSASILASQNNQVGNNILYSGNRGSGASYMAFLGDPTLRTDVVKPATSLVVATTSSTTVSLAWTASADTVLGYHIYRAHTTSGPYTRVSTQLVTGTSATTTFDAYNAQYQVRAVLLETTPSGSYYNNSQGAHQSLTVYAAPVLHALPPAQGVISASSSPIAISVTDDQTLVGDLTLSVISSNTSLVPNQNVSFNFATGTWSMVVRPLNGQVGTTSIRVTASDGVNQTSQSFIYTVADVPDTTAPSVPTGLISSEVTTTQITLTWASSTDSGTSGGTASGVVGYVVYRGGAPIATTTAITFTDTGLSSGASYLYSVRSYDGAGNYSALSSVVTVSTVSTVSSTPGTSSSASGGSSRTRRFISTISTLFRPTAVTPVVPQVNTIPQVNPPSNQRQTTSLPPVQTPIQRSTSVRELQVFLNSTGFRVAPSGVGAPGKETNTFGINTERALLEFLELQTRLLLQGWGYTIKK